ncbi:hypothetical protein KSP40_PGU010139 [Platanthera guangdongensis]|uniref:Uncharacterized protein n=1 Tax=Platanthera guangdongensis TaxID=2320717 RepID=A0ABR2LJJ4_9ASPA
MAAAEARAAWQRAPNRCFVQEDAKRAPKLACCSSSSSTQQNELNIGDATNVQGQRVSSFPLNLNFMNSNLSSDTKWWLQTQPNFSFHKNLIFEQLEGLSTEHVEAEVTNQSFFTDEAIHGASIGSKNKKVCPESTYTVSETQKEYDSEARIQEIKDVTCSIQQQVLEHKVESGACYFQQNLSDAKPIDCLSSIKIEMANLDMEGPWERSSKCEPWWRVSDKEELASFVAQKSLENIENCDLPRAAHICRNPFTCIESWENTIFTSSFGGNVDAGICCPKEMDGKYWRLDHAHHPPFAAGRLASDAWSSNIAAAESTESHPNSGINQSRTQLLEALRLSQTRARNAEMAAQKAYDEKEHIFKLLLKQASHLFAYKQWLQMLQLESLFLRLKIDDRQIASVFPILPWMPLRDTDKGYSRRKRKKQNCWLCKYALLFAVGLSLAGAGLFLGCYLGWLSPTL